MSFLNLLIHSDGVNIKINQAPLLDIEPHHSTPAWIRTMQHFPLDWSMRGIPLLWLFLVTCAKQIYATEKKGRVVKVSVRAKKCIISVWGCFPKVFVPSVLLDGGFTVHWQDRGMLRVLTQISVKGTRKMTLIKWWSIINCKRLMSLSQNEIQVWNEIRFERSTNKLAVSYSPSPESPLSLKDHSAGFVVTRQSLAECDPIRSNL